MTDDRQVYREHCSVNNKVTQVGKAAAVFQRDWKPGMPRQHENVKGRDEIWLARGTRAKGKPAYGEHPGHAAMKHQYQRTK